MTLAVLTGGLALAACGGSSSAKHHARSGALPARAHVVFASDQPVALSHVVSAHTTGRLVASLGFNPGQDGFSFQNYGFIAGAELDQHALRELFGDQVCATAPSDSCTLTPAAGQWAQQVDEAMFGGHCFGFSMTALRFFKHNLSPSAFGAGTPYALSFSPAIQSEIAYGWSTQMIPAVQQAERLGPPSAIVSMLEAAMANRSGDVYTLGLYDAPAGAANREGHAVTPIGIADLGGGHYAILLYDNNKPGTTQAMYVDTQAETWSYQVATNPSQPNAVWSGQGSSNELALAPLSSVLHRQTCPFCSGQGATGFDTVSLGGDPVAHAHLLITTSGGRRLGYVGGRFVDEIKGATVIRPDLNQIWKASPEPAYLVPAGDRLTVTLQGGDPSGHDAAQVHISGPGFGATVAGLVPSSSSQTQITVAPGGRRLALRMVGSLPSRSPTLVIARDQGRAGSELTVTPSRLKPGAKLSVGLAPALRRVSVTSSGASMPVAMTVRAVGPQGSRTTPKRMVGVTVGRQTNLTLGLARVG